MPPFRHRTLPTLLWAVSVRSAPAATATQPVSAPQLTKVAEYRLSQPRLGAAAVAAGDAIYVLGGSAYGAITSVERIDPSTGKTRLLSDRMLPRRFHSVVEYRGRIYVFGGQGYGLQRQPFEEAVEIYDIAASRCSRCRRDRTVDGRIAGCASGRPDYGSHGYFLASGFRFSRCAVMKSCASSLM